MTDTITAPAPAAAAPAPAPVPAPVSAPAPVAAPAPAAVSTPTAPLIDKGGVTSNVDPNKFPIREDYAAALLKEKMAAIPEVTEEQPTVEQVTEVTEPPPAEVTTEVEVPAPDAEAPPAEVEEPEIDLNPPSIATPEIMSKLLTDKPEFGKLLEADKELKGQLFMTARMAAELKPYKEILPDIDSAKEAVASQRAHNDILRTFMGSTTKEGTQQTLAKMMELSYERDDTGAVVMQDGKPVVGQDFYGFVDNVVALDLEHRRADVQARLEANQYHVGAKTEQERDDAIARDQARVAFFDEQLKEVIEDDARDMPESLRKKSEELDRGLRELRDKQHGSKVEERASFEKSVVTGSQERVNKSIANIMAAAKKQRTAMSPYLERTLPLAIGDKLVAKLKADTTLDGRLLSLQSLPATEESKRRRLAEIDRAIQSYLPDIAVEELEAAGVQVLNGSQAKAAKVAGQAKSTKETEIQGARGASSGGAANMSSSAAFDHAQAEWQKANPAKPFDKIAREQILPRVLQLMTARAS